MFFFCHKLCLACYKICAVTIRTYALSIWIILVQEGNWIIKFSPSPCGITYLNEYALNIFCRRADKQCYLGNTIIPWWLHTCGRKTDSNKHYSATEVTNDLEKYSFYGYHLINTSLACHTSNIVFCLFLCRYKVLFLYWAYLAILLYHRIFKY